MTKNTMTFFKFIFSLLLGATVLCAPAAVLAQSTQNTIRVNVGGTAFTDFLGQPWQADNSFSGGSIISTTKVISKTLDQPLYQNARTGAFTYTFKNIVPGPYVVILRFAEIQFTQAGMRKFDVLINGQVKLSNYDIFAAAGGANSVVNRSFSTGPVNGQIVVTTVGAGSISGIDIVPNISSGTTPAPTRTVSSSEVGALMATPNGLAANQLGAVVAPPNSLVFAGSTLPDSTSKIPHGRFHAFASGEGGTWPWFPYSSFKSYESSMVASGGNKMFVTATYAGKSRPVYFVWSLGLNSSNMPTTPPSAWQQALNVSDPNYIKFWAANYVRTVLWQLAQNPSNRWVGADACAFDLALYGVIDDNGKYVPNVMWDKPFPQTPTQYYAMILSFFTQLKTLAPDIKVMCNAGSLGDPNQFKTIFGAMPGLMQENIYDPTWNTNYTRQKFFAQVTNYDWFGSTGKVAVLRAIVSAGDVKAMKTSYMIYLLERGANFFFAPSYKGTTTTANPQDYAAYSRDLGLPTAPLQTKQLGSTAAHVLYSRVTQKGIVYVNWSGQTQTITLPKDHAYLSSSGLPVTQITLPDLTGDYVHY